MWQMAGSPNYVPRRIKKYREPTCSFLRVQKSSTFAPREKDTVWSSKNAFVSTKTTGYYFLSILYVFVVSDQFPSSVTMVRRDQQSVFLSAYPLSLSLSI